MIARVRIWKRRSGPLLPRLVSLAVLAALLGVAWIGLSYARRSLADTTASGRQATVPQNRAGSPATLNRPTTLSKTEKFVYVFDGDAAHYHTAVHTPPEAGRQALPLPVARSRGLVACSDCFRPKE